MIPDNLVHNAFLDNLGGDWVAVAANGHPIARATTEAAVRQAAPDAAHYLNASMLQARVDDLDSGPVEADPVSAGLDAVDEEPVDEEPVDEEPVDEEPVAEEPVAEAPTNDSSSTVN